jgi:hypothetical protein
MVSLNLIYLNLGFSNDLTVLEEGVFQGFANLEVLNLSYSKKLKSIGARVFSGLFKLRNLHLGKCGIECIDQDAFDDSAKIGFLNLSENELKQFVTKCSPKTIDLSKNHKIEMIKAICQTLNKSTWIKTKQYSNISLRCFKTEIN